MTSLAPFPLWTLLCTAATIAAVVVECVFYFGLVGGYYRFGPAVLRRVWRSSVPADAAADAVQKALAASSLAWRRQRHGTQVIFSVRKGAMRVSMWPRIVLQIEQEAGADTATITSETRPFLSLLLLLPAWFLAPGDVVLMAGFFIFLVVAGYVGFWVWERPVRELNDLRDRLGGIGVRVCPKCEYDLRASADRCPECGHRMTPSHVAGGDSVRK